LTAEILDFFHLHNRILVLTGAGVSTASGIPDYRDEKGAWKNSQPIYYQDFIRTEHARQRYWARSAAGWNRFASASPGLAHIAIARLEVIGKISLLITQNVDRLHQCAGSQHVIDLHGSLHQVICLDCQNLVARSEIQNFLLQKNPYLKDITSEPAPDGDARLKHIDYSNIITPHCENCGGILKPDVVFYGENVPPERVQACFNSVNNADAMLIAGSSLMVYSSYRFVRRAHEIGIPIVAINRGITRADELLSMKFEQDCGDFLKQVAESF
jgi:NAD-dependent SIR2 family protein deacetylase